MTTPQLLGVLGGMGPAATADFYTKIIAHTPAVRDQDHLRLVIWADPTVPDRVGAVLHGAGADRPDPYPALLAGARVLRDAGATMIAIPCNTAHFFLPRLARDIAVPYLDMIEETVAAVRNRTGVGLLSTTATRDLYRSRLDSPILPDANAQQAVDAAIRLVKAGDPAAAQKHALEAVRRMANAGVEALVLACSELPLALRGCAEPPDMDLVDPTDLLARAAVRRYLAESPRTL